MTQFRDAQIEALQEFHTQELNLDSDRAWIKWLAKIERATGLHLDGDRTEAKIADGTADPACLDECFDWFEAGVSALVAAETILARVGRSVGVVR